MPSTAEQETEVVTEPQIIFWANIYDAYSPGEIRELVAFGYSDKDRANWNDILWYSRKKNISVTNACIEFVELRRKGLIKAYWPLIIEYALVYGLDLASAYKEWGGLEENTSELELAWHQK